MPERDFFTLVARVRAHASAEHLDLCELLKLADSCQQPPDEADAWLWAEEFAKPLLRELVRRYDAQQRRQEIDVPNLLRHVRKMRQAQRAYWSGRRLPKTDARPLLKQAIACERQVDELLAAEMQPSLFSPMELPQ